MWSNFIEPGLKKTSTIFLTCGAAKTQDPQAGEASSNLLRSLTGSNFFPLTNMYSAAGLRLRVMWIYFKKLCIMKWMP